MRYFNTMQKNRQKGSISEFLVILVLILVVLAGLSIWIKPWEWFLASADANQAALANRTAQALHDYYLKTSKFPWNDPTADYSPQQTRSEAAFVFLSGEDEDNGWWQNLWSVISVTESDRTAQTESEELVILKQISSGGRVAVCFLPRSEKYQLLAAEYCREDSNGRRLIAPYAVAGYDPCAGVEGATQDNSGEIIKNLYCEVIE